MPDSRLSVPQVLHFYFFLILHELALTGLTAARALFCFAGVHLAMSSTFVVVRSFLLIMCLRHSFDFEVISIFVPILPHVEYDHALDVPAVSLWQFPLSTLFQL